MRGHAESEVGRTKAPGGSGPGEGLPEGQLARLVGGAQARNQARLGPSITGVRVGVERLDRHPKLLQHARGDHQRPIRGRRLEPLGVPDRRDGAGRLPQAAMSDPYAAIIL